jgi:phosphoribosylformylglycinamidine synthase
VLAAFFATVQRLASARQLLAYHDIADGGLFATLAEMAFASRCGLDISIEEAGNDVLGTLFAEELGAVIQVDAADRTVVRAQLDAAGLACREIGAPAGDGRIRIRFGGATAVDESRIVLHRAWSATTHELQRMRDDPEAVDQEYARILDTDDRDSRRRFTFEPSADIAAPFIATGAPAAIAILREQGVNGQVEMAAAFDRAGFDAFRRAHDRHRRWPAIARRVPRLSSRAVDSPTATCSAPARDGQSRFCSTRAPATTSPRSLPAAIRFALGVCNGCR